MAIGFAEQHLLDDSSFIVLSFYESSAFTCTELRGIWPRPRALIGPIEIALNAEARASGVRYRNDMIPAGKFVVIADALDVERGLVGVGCAQEQAILPQVVSQVRITITSPR